ncbi:MAG TPA: carbon-nitrogen hydrolase family protein [Chloroflexaceae bacterium]|nr:carbon-nitrogen hydrolase family protein [Chloroflexaceae bacterium]
MRVTVCELRDEPTAFAEDWRHLVGHVAEEQSDLVILPEMGFASWFAASPSFDAATWQAAVVAHDRWLARLGELAPAVVVASRPVDTPAGRRNEGFVWSPAEGYRPVRQKYYLPDEEGYWEARWYDRGDGDFPPAQAGRASLGLLICTELWFQERARAYGRGGAHLIAVPRATGKPTLEKWLVGGRAASVAAGAYVGSSNKRSDDPAVDLGGQGWLVGPDGEVLAITTPATPVVTVVIDLAHAMAAKATYPRYVRE